jgi:acyl-CoA thioesterase FadM
MLHAARHYGYFDWLDQHADGYRPLRIAGTDLVIVANGCEYRTPARLDELLSIETRPVSMGTSSLTVSFTVRGEERIVAIGHARYVCVAGGSAVPIPASLRRVLDPGGDRSPA